MDSSECRQMKIREVALVNAHSIKGNSAPSRIEYIDISSVGTGEYIEPPKEMSFADSPGRARRIVKVGDTILSTVRPNRRSFLFLSSPSSITVASTGFAVLTPTSAVDARYLYYWVTRQDFTDYLSLHAKGAAYPAVSAEDIGNGEIRVPPLPVQRRIASILSAYDDLIENSRRRIKILETMARALYREWFVNFRFPGHEKVKRVKSTMGEIPEGWEVIKLSDLTSYINRGISPTYNENGDSIVINQKCIRDQQLNLEPARRQSKQIPTDKKIKFGDVLINSTGVGTLGRVAQVYQEIESCTVDTHVTIVRPNAGIDVDFFGICLLSLQETLERLGIGATGQTELGRSSIANIECGIPSIPLQQRFGIAVRPMRISIYNYITQIQNLRRTRDHLLPRLMSGQIDLKVN